MDLFSRRIDGSGSAARLSGADSSDGDVQDFDISPNGQRVIYTADFGGEDVLKFYVRDIDGSGEAHQLSKRGEGSVWEFTITATNQVLYLADDDQTGVDEAYFRSIEGARVALSQRPGNDERP